MGQIAGLHFAGIIPARFASSRFPGKPLAMIGNRTMIQRVWEQARKSLDKVFVATDDERISDAVLSFGGEVIMTSPNHRTGTERCAEAIEKIIAEGNNIDVIVNVQGDEPFIRPEQIDLLISSFSDDSVEIATLVRKTRYDEDIFNPNQPKVILDLKSNAIYFSRSVIPFIRDINQADWAKEYTFLKHLGLYAYRTTTLRKITQHPMSPLEKAESLEQNRWLENGYKIRASVTEWESMGIDTPADLETAKLMLNKSNEKIY